MPSFLMIQWGIVGFFVIIHFLIGFLRGTSKSTYFTIVSIIMTVVTLFIVSKLSLSLVISSGLTFQSLVALINGAAGGVIPENIIEYLLAPEVVGIAIAIVDLVIRIVAFIILYPILKFMLTLSIFKPIWKHIVLPRLVKKQNEKMQIKHEERYDSTVRFKSKKRLHKNILSRLFGGAVGSLRGVIVAFIFLVPLLVIAGFASQIQDSVTIQTENQNQELSTGNEVASIIPSEVQDILDNIDEMNKGGLSAIVKDIKIQGKSLDRYIFDKVFTTNVVVEDTKTPINFGNELEHIVGIAGVVIKGGYLDDFNADNISKDDLDNLELIFSHIGQSQLIGYMIPAAAKFGIEKILPDQINGINLYERDASKAALDQFYDIKWDEEFDRIFGIAEAALNFASVSEYKTYMEQPELLAELTPEQGVLLANILRSLGNLEVLSLINVAIDYATTLEQVQQQIKWMEPTEVEGYLQDKLSFILDDPNFFIGDEGDIHHIAQIIETIFSDEFGEANLSILVDSFNDPQALIENQNPEWVGAIIEDLVGVELLIKSIPVGVDFAFYTQLRDSMDAELADQIIAELETIEWDAEIINVGDIYKEALKLGVGAIFGDNPNYYAFIDEVAVEHMDSLRTIVEYIFEGSDVINAAIELASPVIVDKFVTDEALKVVVNDILMSDPSTDVVDFNFGQEINSILSIVESVFKFTTSEELASMPGLETNALLEVVSQFGMLTDMEYTELRDAINGLQILSRAGESGLDYVKTKIDVPYLYVPEVVELNKDITVLLDIAYSVANYIHTQSPFYLDYQEIDFTNLLKDDDFRAYFLNTVDDKHSNLIFLNIAHNLKYFSENESISEYLSLPTDLVLSDIDSVVWEEEVNALLGSIFDLASSVGDINNVTLSVKGILDIKNDPKALSIEVFTQFSDQAVAAATFGSLDSSRILRNSFVKTIDKLGASLGDKLYGYQLGVPAHLIDDGMLVEGTITDLIYSIAVLVEDMNNTLAFDTIGDAVNFKAAYEYVDAFNNVNDETLRIFGSADLIHGIISDVLLNPELQQAGRDLINERQPLGVTVDENFLNLSRVGDILGEYEFSDLLIAIKSVELTPEVVQNFKVEMFTYVQSLDQAKLDLLFAPYLLRELIDQVIANDGVIDKLVELAQGQFDTLQTNQKILAGFDPNISHIISSLPNLKDADGFFDTNEIKSWILTFKELDVASMEELKGLGDLQKMNEKIATSFVVETLFSSRWIYGLVNDVFTTETTLDQIAALATDQVFKQTGVSHTFTKDEVSFIAAKYGIVDSVSGNVKVSELKNFMIAGTRLNWTKLGLGTGKELISNLSNELLTTGFDGHRHIDVILESKLLVAIFDKVMNFEYNTYDLDEIAIGFINKKLETIATLNGLQLTTDILHYDLRAYDDNQVIKKEEFIEMIEAVTYIDFSGTIGINTFYQMTVDGTFGQLFDSRIIHSFISNALTNQEVQNFGVDKANAAQTIVALTNDILAVDPELMDGDLFKVSELENILVALHTLGLTDSAGFSSIGIATFTNLLGANVDVNGDDDFDRVFGANYIYVLLDRILKLDSLGDYVGTTLGDALGISITTFDTTPSAAMLADGIAPYETIENGRIPKDEFRAMITSLNLLGDIKAIGLNTFTDMIDPNVAEDDFTIFIASDFIYTILARLFDNPAFGDYVGDMLAGAFGDDPITLDMATPEDALGLTGVEEDLMTRYELRQLMVSFDMLGFDGSSEISITTIMNMIDQNIDPITNEDDFSRFIESIFIQDKVSQLLLSEQVIELIANARFDYVDFVMPNVSLVTVGTRDRMIKQEIYDLFYGLKLVGLTDFDNVDISLDDITSLTDSEEDQLLDSSYLYVVLDLMLKSEATLTIPSDALEVAGNYNGMIKKPEIKSLLGAFDILGETDPANIDANNITIEDLEDMLDLNSSIIDQLISDAIEDSLTTVPLSAYNGTRISRTELYKMVETLLILGGGDDQQTLSSLMPIDTATITTQTLDDIHNVDSRIVDRITSEAIIDSGISIHSLAYDPLSEVDGLGQKLDIKRTELKAMLDAMGILDIDISNASAVDTSKYTPANVGLLLDLESLLIYRLISESIIDQSLQTDESLAVDGDDNYDPEAIGSDIKIFEMEALVEAMTVLGITDLSVVINIDTVSIAQLEQTHILGLGKPLDPLDDVYESRIIHRLISDAIVDSLYSGDAVNAPDGVFMTLANKDLKPLEVSALIKSLSEMGLTQLSDPIDVDTITVAQLREVHYLGLGIDPSGDDYDSIVIHRLISDAVVDSLYTGSKLNAPDGVLMADANEDLEPDEISALIEALDLMGLAKLSDPINVDDLTVAQLKNIHYLGLAIDPSGDDYESIVIHRLISDAVVDSLYTGSKLNAPDGVLMADANEDLKPLEISALIEALDLMGLAKLSDPINVDDLTVAQLENIHYLGLGKPADPLDDVYESIVIHRLISDAVVDSLYTGSKLNAPDGVLMADTNEDIKPLEVSALIEALNEMGLAKLSDPINVDNLTLVQLTNIHYLGLGTDPVLDEYDSLIIHRLISDSVVSTVTVPDDAYMTVAKEDVKADEISALIEALDVMGLTKLSDPIDVNGLTVATLKDIHYLGLGTDPVLDEYESLIIHRMVSDAVVDSLYSGNPASAPSGVFMTVANLDLVADEVSALIAAMEEMSIVSLGASLSFTNPTRAQLQNLHYLGLAVDPVDEKYQSLIVHRLISDSVVSALTVPDDAYMTAAQEDVKVDEISALIAAMAEMGITNLSAGLSFSNPTVTQLQNLHYLGLAEDPGIDLYDSYIVHRLISDSVDSALTVPDDAYMTVAQEDIKVDEISALIAAMNVMGMTNLTAGLAFTNPTRTEISALHDLGLNVPVGNVYDSLIVHRLLSNAISAVMTVPSEAYMVGSAVDIKPAEISHIIESMVILNVTNVADIVAEITVAKLKGLSNQDVDDLVEATNGGPNVIVYYMISDVVDPTNTLYDFTLEPTPDDFYVLDLITNARIRLKRASIADALTRI